ncbi:MAG: protein kinase, partial [Bacteroidales bacterium]|nr:protein kinase [Bacteroidales bacterium]
IVNSAGQAEPRLFKAKVGPAFFEDGFAFSLKEDVDPIWLVQELNESYIHRQLHPYGNNEMVPEPLSEEDYLNLTLYREVEIDLNLDQDETANDNEQEEDKGCLDVGFELNDGKYRYTILDFIANGAFGYTYKAEMTNTQNGDKEIVAIKEFYPQGVMPVWRENNKVIYPECQKEDFARYREMFESEPNFILSMKDTPDNHVTEVKTMFYYEPTGTVYYVMKFYAGQSLKNMIFADQVPSSEKLLIEKIVIPMCKGLHAMHSHRILHLDIKPDNVVIDENGDNRKQDVDRTRAKTHLQTRRILQAVWGLIVGSLLGTVFALFDFALVADTTRQSTTFGLLGKRNIVPQLLHVASIERLTLLFEPVCHSYRTVPKRRSRPWKDSRASRKS